MKLISWNVNGLRACVGKGFTDFFTQANADVFCIQETKMQPGQLDLTLPGYHQYWNAAEKKGYSGTAVFTKTEPLAVTYGIGIPSHDTEGRVITCEYPAFFLVNVYTPNSQRELTRLSYRLQWEDDFRAYLSSLESRKPVIVCGDLNVAHAEIDLKNPKPNRGSAGFTDQEREKLTTLLAAGWLDSYRTLYPDTTGAYTWWSYMYHARANNAGWRIDYFLLSRQLRDALRDSQIHPDVPGSDHCPISLTLA